MPTIGGGDRPTPAVARRDLEQRAGELGPEDGFDVLSALLYFAACFVVIMGLKQLWLAEYGIEFSGVAVALLAALVTAKVVIILDHVPLSRWLQGSPGILEVVARSILYTTAVLVALVLERAFESRAEQGGLMPALANVFGHPDLPKIWATTLAVGLSFLAYNVFEIVRRTIGGKRMRALFLSSNAEVR